MKNTYFLAALLFINSYLYCQAPPIEWQRCYGGSNYEGGYYDHHYNSIRQTSDKGFILAGYSNSWDGNLTKNYGGNDFWIVKMDSAGIIQWQKSYGGSALDCGYYAEQTTDGGYIMTGHSASTDGNVTGNKGGFDYWVIKLNSTGNIVWEKSYGGTGTDYPYKIKQTKDGGYIIAGYSSSDDKDVKANNGGADYWIVKINSTGAIQWQKNYGGKMDDIAYSIEQTTDGGYIVAGSTNSDNGDVSKNQGGMDYWILKLNADGSIKWNRTFGGSGDDVAYSVKQTKDGGYIIAGTTNSNNGDVKENHGNNDYWIIKLNSDGNTQWMKTFGGREDDEAYSVEQTTDDGYIIAGFTYSANGDVKGNHGGNDYWIIKLDSSGKLVWQKPLGGDSYDFGYSIQQTLDGGYIIAGTSSSNNGDVSGNHGLYDFWVVKLKTQVVTKFPSLSVYIPHLFSQVGTTNFHIPLIITDKSDDAVLSNCSYTAHVRFDASTYLPTGVTVGKIIKDSIDKFNFRNLFIECDSVGLKDKDTILTEMIGTVLLGDSLTPLEITGFNFISPKILIDTLIDGSLQTQTCAFNVRRIDNKPALTFQMHPNPANDYLEFTIDGGTEEHYDIRIYNLQGQKMYSYASVILKNETNKFRIETGNFATGIYQVVFQTISDVQTKRLLLIK